VKPGGLIGEVRWTLPYVGLLVYAFVILTYRLPIGDVAIVAALLGVAFQRDRFRFPPMLAWFGLYLIWAAVSGHVFSPYKSIVGETLLDYGKIWLIALVAVNALRTPGQLRFFAIFFLFWFATHPVRGALFNNFVYGYTASGRAVWNIMYRNPNDLAALTLLPLAMAAGLLDDRNKWIRRGALASVIVLPTLIIMTESRGGFVALAMFGVLTLTGQRKRLRGALIFVLLGTVVVLASPSGAWERIATIGDAGSDAADSSARQRRMIWRVAGEIIDDHRLTGIGLGAYPQANAAYAAANSEFAFAGGTRDTHSTYLNVLAETGYPGLLIFLGSIAAVLVPAERARRRYKQANPVRATDLWYLECALLAYLTASIFGTYSHLPFLWLQLAVITVSLPLLRNALPAPRVRRGRVGPRGFLPLPPQGGRLAPPLPALRRAPAGE
jgi:O-antigen ligase